MSRAVFGTAAYAALQAPTMYNFTLILFTFSSLPVNLLLIRKIRRSGSMKSSGRTIDELSITYGLIAQGCFPCFVIAIVYNILLTQGVIFSIEFKMIVDSTGYVVLGINTLSSFIFIRSFRRHLMELFGK
ncbi:hypothetical protein PENTCL1PPCAC_16562, partial [Pristionchus entomophagus]